MNIMLSSAALGLVLLLHCGSLVKSDSTCRGAVNPLFVFTQKECACREEKNCRSLTEPASGAAEEGVPLCRKHAQRGEPTVKLVLNIHCNLCQVSTVQVWQANPAGRYSSRDECSRNFTVPATGPVRFSATLPGEVIEGYQANKASKHRGFLHTLVRRSDGTYRSQLFRYDDGTAYVSTSGDITRVITCRRNGVAVNGKDLVNAVKMGGVECHANASVDDCTSDATSTSSLNKYVNHVKAEHKIHEPSEGHTGNSPTLRHCPKVKHVVDHFRVTSLALVVEVMDLEPHRKNCSTVDIPKVADTTRQLQSTYMGIVQSVLKDDMASQHFNQGLSELLSLKKDHTNTKLVQIQYVKDVDCCDELIPGRQYVIMGVSLPLSSKKEVADGTVVYRVWADTVYESAMVLHTLLNAQ